MASSVAESLRGCAGLEVLQLEVADFDPGPKSTTVSPHAVIVDLSVVQLDSLSVLLRKYPDLLLVGIDPASDEVMVLSSHPARAMSTDALLQIIEKDLSHSEKPQ
jgi:hypothetical protein